MTAGIVTEFQREAPLEGLAIGDLRFRLDPGPPRRRLVSADLGVPGSEVSGYWQWHFCTPAERLVEAPAKPFEERQLCAIPDWIPRRVDLDYKVEAKNREPRTQLGYRRPIDLAALKPAQLASRAARGSRAVAETEPGGDACVPVLLTETEHRRPKAPSSAIVRPFPGTHRRVVSRPPLITGLPGLCPG